MAIRRCLIAVLGVIVVWCGTVAHALINPHFTPVHLVKQAALILTVELRPGAAQNQYAATVREVLKGQPDGKTLRLDLAKAINPQNAAALRELAALGKPALFFVGEFGDAADAKGGSVPDRRGFLHISGQWAEFYGAQDGAWSFNRIDAPMQGVWAGGTDMLRRAVHYILHDDDPDVPVIDGASWDANQRKIATCDGKLRAVRPIDLAGDGKLVVFVARDQGDRLLIGDPKSRDFTDATASRRLASRSQAFAWADFNGDGRLDLVSFDGRTLSFHAQQADGTFQARPLALGGMLERGCVGLAAVATGKPGLAGLVLSTDSCPVLVTWDADGKCSPCSLAADGVEWQKLGPAGRCLVADFDGVGHPDVLQPFAAGSVLFRGLGSGRFASGVACAVRLGSGPSNAGLGDFDGDGRLDILAVAADAVRIWQNEGAGVFAETLNLSGEIAYISKPGGVDCAVGDVNNDGRQDALIAYAGLSPQIFFNRGYRSFGHAHTLDLAERQLLTAAEQGQQSVCLADLDRDGAQDMVLALNNGEIWVFYRENEDREARSVTASLPVSGPHPGPLAVTGWIGERCLGAWNVMPGSSPAFFGRREAGPVTLKWRLPDGKEREKEIVVESGTVRAEIK